MEKATIVIYFDEPGKYGYPFQYNNYIESYSSFSDLCRQRGLDLFIARGDSYEGNMRFSSGWRLEKNEIIDVPRPIQADAILVKGLRFVLKTGPNDLVLNHPELDVMAGNKWLTYELLHEFMKKTYQINEENWQEVAAKISTDKIVLKPEVGTGGSGIIIADKAGFDFRSYVITEPYVAQEFIDASKGIPGLVDGYHDLRLIAFNDEIKLSYLRFPPENSLLSNISQGGTARAVSLEDVPEKARRIAAEANAKLAKYNPRNITFDFLFEGDHPYLCEINPRPGFPHAAWEGPEFVRMFHDNLLGILTKAIAERRSK